MLGFFLYLIQAFGDCYHHYHEDNIQQIREKTIIYIYISADFDKEICV